MMQGDPTVCTRLSWRDPDGFVVNLGGRILRAVVLDKAEQTRLLVREPWLMDFVRAGAMPSTEELRSAPPALPGSESWFWLEHEALSFPVYPHEITALQLFDSGELTLRIALQAAANGWLLKDASAWNVLHCSGKPVFVDLLSFERPDNLGRWTAYGQFVRHFLLPLLLHRKLGMTPADAFLTNRDGVSPERAHQLLSAADLMSPVALELIVLPKFLARAGGRLIASQSRRQARGLNPQIAREIILGTLRRLQRMLKNLQPTVTGSRATSVWADYEQDRQHYSDEDLVQKRQFVREHLQGSRTVLDLGCNAGEFSQLAAECGATVIAADADHPALSRLYSRIRGHAQSVSPVLLNIGRPTPAVGWLNAEIGSFLDRAHRRFDCVMMLGLLHHLLVGERMTLSMLADMLDRLMPSRVILEWIAPKDPKFEQLAGLNAALYSHLDGHALEALLQQKFRLVAKMNLPCGTRVMYHWEREVKDDPAKH